MKPLILAVAIMSVMSAPLYGQNRFECGLFDRGVCLRRGDTICNEFGRCVDRDAVCFSRNTCDYRGFVCRSDFDALQTAYDEEVAFAEYLSGEVEASIRILGYRLAEIGENEATIADLLRDLQSAQDDIDRLSRELYEARSWIAELEADQ